MDDPTAVDTGVPCVHYPDDIVEMGCYERCPGDIDGDGDVDLSDLALLLAAYGCCDPEPCYNPAADLDDDGCVDLGDLALLLAVYGGC